MLFVGGFISPISALAWHADHTGMWPSALLLSWTFLFSKQQQQWREQPLNNLNLLGDGLFWKVHSHGAQMYNLLNLAHLSKHTKTATQTTAPNQTLFFFFVFSSLVWPPFLCV